MQKEKRVVLWLAFSVLFALAPLFVNFLLIRDHPDFGLSGLYDRGELFLVSSVLAADAVGRLFGRSSNRSLLLILCLICASFCSLRVRLSSASLPRSSMPEFG